MSDLERLKEQLIGKDIGSYRIESLLGYGGMGAVFRAVHKTLDMQAAIKVLRLPDSPDADAALSRQRFLDEAQALSKVRHTNLVRLFDVGELLDGTLYLQMELLEGVSLSCLLAQHGGRLPLPKAIELARQIASVLAEVHASGIIHRDLKPSNVMVVTDPEATGGQRAKILDFGLAKFRETRRTKSGVPTGTPRYMSPEQCEGSTDLDGRTDVYALGLLLFEMLSGESPYPVGAEEPLPWMYAHVEGRPRPLRRLLPEAPVQIEEMIAVMLDKLPSQRPSAQQVEEQLRSLFSMDNPRNVESVSAVFWRIAQRWRTPLGVATTVIGLGLVALGGRWLMARVQGIAAHKVELTHPTVEQIEQATASTQAPDDMVLIPRQRFVMGSAPAVIDAAFVACQRADPGCQRTEFEREQPQRAVTVRSFYMDRFEVTNHRYAEWLNAPLRPLYVEHERLVSDNRTVLIDLHPDHSGIERHDGRYRARLGTADLPVVQVTWYGARQFCKSMGRDLPTEAQWELAARGLGGPGVTEPSEWPWGNEPPRCDGVVVSRQDGGVCTGIGPSPQLVGKAMQDLTRLRVYDLGGNVREWVRDRFIERYPACGTCVDPVAPEESGPEAEPLFRSVRGGNWFQPPTGARAAGRSRWRADQAAQGIGFRCVLEIQNP